MKVNFFARVILIMCLATAVFGCAGQRPPEGGPIDRVPPNIASVYPQPYTTSFADTKIVLEFSKYVDRRSVEESIFISPYVSDIEYDWSGTEVEARFNSPLKKNTTYVVTVGTDVVDMRAQNRMAKAFTFAFATGAQIDQGAISGSVVDEKPEGVMIFAYRLNDINPDTLNPMAAKPDYITQTGKNGIFAVTNLALGTYRLFAVRDEYRNLLYDPEIDAAGTVVKDITLTAKDTLATGINFILAKEDTTAPRLISAQAPDNRHLMLQFSEPADSESVTPGSISIVDTLSQQPLGVSKFFFTSGQHTTLALSTEIQKKDSGYRVTATGIKDLSGHTINPLANSKLFKGSAAADTLPPRLIAVTVTDSTYLAMLDERFIFSFDDVLPSPFPSKALTLVHGLKDTIPVTLSMMSPAAVQVIPEHALKPHESYALHLRPSLLPDAAGNVVKKDTVLAYKFMTIDPEQLSSIDGSFLNPAFPDPTSVVVEARNISVERNSGRTAKVGNDRKFSFPNLRPGNYTLKAFDDVNRNKRHDAGNLFPFKPAEQFVLYPDTIKVRARWPVDGVIFK